MTSVFDSPLVQAMRAARATAAAPVQASAPARHSAIRRRRSFDAAEVSRLTASFTTEHVSLNDDLERNLRIMRARSRHLYKNNDYARRFFRMAQNNIVGPNGVTLTVPCLRGDGTIDEYDRAICENSFARFSQRGVFDVTGKLSRLQFERLLVLHLARDGEFLVRRIRDRKINAFGYALQILDPVLLDESYRSDLGNGGRIRMGVETDIYGKPVAYWLLEHADIGYQGRRKRVPAEEIWHGFIQEEANQVRGYPWIHASMRRLNDMGGYEQAAIIAARVGATNMGFFIPPVESAGDPLTHADSTETDADGNEVLVRDATGGTFEELPPGYDFKSFNPDYPHANFGEFIKACLRGVSSGLNVDYSTLANDPGDANFSSQRLNVLETREEWMGLQALFIESFHEQLAPEWLKYAFVSGQLDPLPVSKFDKYNVAVWYGRRWPWLDPFKDMQTKVMELENNLNSFSNVMRDIGRDPETVWKELERDRERFKQLGIMPVKKSTPAALSNPDAAAAAA